MTLRPAYAPWVVLAASTLTATVALGTILPVDEPLESGQSATLLLDGKVLVVGGAASGGTETGAAILYDPWTNTSTSAGSLQAPRSGHTATVRGRRVLIIGGTSGGVIKPTVEAYDMSSKTFLTMPAMSGPRTDHTATVFGSGKLLVVGGRNATGAVNTVEILDPITNAWTAGPPLTAARYGHSATTLLDGRVLVCGGFSTPGVLHTSCSVYDPTSNTWTATPAMAQGRGSHTATLQSDGKVTLVGGSVSSNFLLVERYNPSTNSFTTVAPIAQRRSVHTASLLGDGRLLVVGGNGAAGSISSVEVYDAAANTWTTLAPTQQPRALHVATVLSTGEVLLTGGGATTLFERYSAQALGSVTSAGTSGLRTANALVTLPDGKVLLTGGHSGNNTALSSSVFYDGTWHAFSVMREPRMRHSSNLLATGKVLIAGGENGALSASSELLDLSTGVFGAGPPLAQARKEHTATLLDDGSVLLAGGTGENGTLSTTELYDAAGNQFIPGPSMLEPRTGHTSSVLYDGKVLITGGSTSPGLPATASAELFSPSTRAFVRVGNLTAGRAGHTATVLANGRVVIVGGRVNGVASASVEIFDPTTALFSAGPALASARAEHTATLLPSGRILVAGGEPSGSVEVYDPIRNAWTSHGLLATPRSGHLATLFCDNRVLLSGGLTNAGVPAFTAELAFDGRADSAFLVPRMDGATYQGTPNADLTLTGTQFLGPSELDSGNSRGSSLRFPNAFVRGVDSALIRPITVTTVNSGELIKILMGTDVAAVPHSLRVTVSGALSPAATVMVTSSLAPNGTIHFRTPPIQVKAGICSTPITVELRKGGSLQPVAASTQLLLASSSPRSTAFQDPACATPINGVTLQSGESSATFYVGNTTAEIASIDVQGAGYASASQTVTYVPHGAYRARPTAPSTVVAGSTHAVTFQVEDTFQNPVGLAGFTATLQPDGEFLPGLSGQLAGTTDSSGSATVSARFHKAGTTQLCAFVLPAIPLCTPISVQAGAPSKILLTPPAQTSTATAFTVVLQAADSESNPVPLSGFVAVTLQGNDSCTAGSQQVVLDAATGQASFDVSCKYGGSVQICGDLVGLSRSCAMGQVTGPLRPTPKSLSLQVEPSRTELPLGGRLTVKVTVENQGDTTFDGLWLALGSNGAAEILSGQGAQADAERWMLEPLAPGELREVLFDARVVAAAAELRVKAGLSDGSETEEIPVSLQTTPPTLASGCSCQSGDGLMPILGALLTLATRWSRRSRSPF